jgi:hypothetical protein
MKVKWAKVVLVFFVMEMIALGIIVPTFGKFLSAFLILFVIMAPPFWALNTLINPPRDHDAWRNYQHSITGESDEVD